ncbi:MAG: DUF4388 domain-containing protein [Thermoanaerobaculales bacterium]
MANDEFMYRGEIERTPLPSMLATVHRYGVPGVMEFTGEEATKRVFFVDGDVIFATSSDRSESLGQFLVRKGTITDAQHDASTEELKRSPGLRHGAVLVKMGYLGSEQLGGAVRQQVQEILWSLFNWDCGEVRFRVGRFRDDEVFQIKIPTPRAILAGCRHIADPKVVTARLGGRKAVFKKLPVPPHLESFVFEGDEAALLKMVDGKLSVYELCEQGPMGPGVNARSLYALVELQLLTRVGDSGSGIRIQVRG